MKTAAGKSSGNSFTNVHSGPTPPAEAPTTTMSRFISALYGRPRARNAHGVFAGKRHERVGRGIPTKNLSAPVTVCSNALNAEGLRIYALAPSSYARNTSLSCIDELIIT